MLMKKYLLIFLAAILVIAVMPVSAIAGAPKDIEIHEVNIEGFVPPVVGSTPEHSYTLYAEEGEHYFIVYSYWHDNTEGTDMFVEQVPFVADHMYSTGCIICIDDGYVLADDCVYSFNGDPALVDPDFPQPYYLGSCIVLQTVAVAPVDPSAVTPGDVDGNGTIDMADALLTLRCAMGLVELSGDQLAAADVNADGAVGMDDALMILRAAMGLAEL